MPLDEPCRPETPLKIVGPPTSSMPGACRWGKPKVIAVAIGCVFDVRLDGIDDGAVHALCLIPNLYRSHGGLEAGPLGCRNAPVPKAAQASVTFDQ